MTRTDGVWLAALVALVLVGYGLVPSPDVRAPVDTFSEDASGKKAFFFVTEALLPQVSRSPSSLIPEDDDTDTLVLLGPARYPTRAQWQTLHDWVSRGRALVFAARWQDPAVQLESFGIEIVPRRERSTGNETVDTDLVDADQGAFDWRSAGEVRTIPKGASDVTIELSENGSAQVLWRPIGDGVIVVVASDYVFTNRSLATENNGLLAFRILETAGPVGPVVFDESMNASGSPAVVGILLEEPFRWMTLQLMMLTFLFGWMASRRFGPVASSEDVTRRSLVEHAEALGNLHFQTGSGGRLLRSYLELFRHELGLRASGADGLLERDPNVWREQGPAIDSVLNAARRANLPRGRVAEAVELLARWRHQRRPE